MNRRFRKPIGTLKDGTHIWSYCGAEGEDDGDIGDGNNGDGGSDSPPNDEIEDDDSVDEDGLNSKGRNAIESERKSAERARRSLKPWSNLRREFGVTPDQIREILVERAKETGSPSEEPKGNVDADQIRRQAEHEALAKVNDRLVKASIRAEATSFLENPKDAELFLDFSEYEVNEDGEVDSDQIKRDLQALLRDRPYLRKARKGDGREGGDPDYDGGSRKSHTRTTMDSLIRQTARRR